MNGINIPFFDLSPVDKIPESFNVVRSPVLIIEIIGMFPYITSH